MQKYKYLGGITLIFMLLCLNFQTTAQQKIVITGAVIDLATNEPVSSVSVTLEPHSLNIGTMTDDDGYYSIVVPAQTEKIVFSRLGYEPVSLPYIYGKSKTEINVSLKSEERQLQGATVIGKRPRYRNKDNPAVELIRKAIANKDKNRIEASDFYEYTKYEKIELSLNELSDSIRKSAAFRKFDFLSNYIDTTENGVLSLPFFLRENITENYFRKSPTAAKELLIASRIVDFNDFIETATLDAFLDGMVGRSNIYNNTIMVLENEYQSPLSSLGPNFYRYYIADTLDVNETSCIKMTFFPRNTSDFGFTGNLFITNDSLYALKRAELRFTKDAGVNFVRDFYLIQEYTLTEDVWALTQDDVQIDFGLTDKKSAILGKRTNTYHGYVFNKRIPDSKFRGETQEKLPEHDMRGAEYWDENRPLPLSKSEQGVYDMASDMKNDKVFNRIITAVGIVYSGLADAGKFDLGPLESLFSFNDVEGARFRIGGKTNARFHPHLFLDGYLAYGVKDERFKYRLGAAYSFNKKKLHPWEYPINLLNISYEYNTKTPGQSFLFGDADRFLLSFRRGKAERMLYQRKFELSYEKEFIGGLTIKPSFTHTKEEPGGALKFQNASGNIASLTSSVLGLKLRYAHDERFYQIQQNRFPLNHTNPVFTINYRYGINDFLGNDFDFHRLEIGVDKRTWFSSLGFFDVWLRAGKIWNAVPYPLLFIPQANQNYAYQDEAFNMMNYMEFVADQYASANLSYCFNGWIFNRIPLIKKLKWREYITFKTLWGTVSEHNLPQNNPDLYHFPTDVNGNPTTFSLEDKPYMEAGFGIDNIFKVLRVDLIRRLNYLDNPDVPEWGVRFRMRFVF